MEKNGVFGVKMNRIVTGLIVSITNKIERDREQFPAIAAGILVFVGSICFAPLYVEGDQWTYHRAYQLVEGLGLFLAHYQYESAISGAEYLHFFIIWIASTLAIEKNLVMALANFMLAAYSVELVRRWGGSLYIAMLLVLTNYYWYVLYFSAERLKFGILFLVLSLLSINSVLVFAVFSTLALLSHSSILFIYSGIWLMMAANLLTRSEVSFKDKMIRVGGAGVLIVLVTLLGSFHIRAKLVTYLAQHHIENFMALGPIFILVSLSCLYSKRIVEPVLLYLPAVMGIVLLGGSRLNMLAYFIFLYYCLSARNGFNIGVIATSLYLGYKSVGYVSNVIQYGHGFP